MEEQHYSNREIREMVSDIKNTLGRIEAQTIKTNGRVNKLENWRAYATGAIAVIIIVIIPILSWALSQLINIHAK